MGPVDHSPQTVGALQPLPRHPYDLSWVPIYDSGRTPVTYRSDWIGRRSHGCDIYCSLFYIFDVCSVEIFWCLSFFERLVCFHPLMEDAHSFKGIPLNGKKTPAVAQW